MHQSLQSWITCTCTSTYIYIDTILWDSKFTVCLWFVTIMCTKSFIVLWLVEQPWLRKLCVLTLRFYLVPRSRPAWYWTAPWCGLPVRLPGRRWWHGLLVRTRISCYPLPAIQTQHIRKYSWNEIYSHESLFPLSASNNFWTDI